MAATLVRTSARAALRSGASATPRTAGVAGLTFARGKATLPDLKCMSFLVLSFCLAIGVCMALQG